ncbi:MAG: DNA adenine methylase [Clostridia bacterium]
MQPLIKWPGGKSTEIEYIKDIIPPFDRYVEPFCGGAAVFFHLEPKKALINDISQNLTSFYNLIKIKDDNFKTYMYDLNKMWDEIKIKANKNIHKIVSIYKQYKVNASEKEDVKNKLNIISENLFLNENIEIIDIKLLIKEVKRMLSDKFFRTIKNEIKNNKDLSNIDLEENLLTGIASGIYMAVRTTLNGLDKETKLNDSEYSKKIACFYFIREFCYGSMFRYNKSGDFNIPYGGKGYNHKDYKKKLDILFGQNTYELLKNTNIQCGDFELIFNHLKVNDFVFIDPPYDTNFSDYENKSFDKNDQERLSKILEITKAKFILIIKNTPYIFKLYNKECFKIKSFDNSYSYCVKNRNNRKVEHLIITNF